MSDLIERLKNYDTPDAQAGYLMDEAAEEVERLTAENKEMLQAISTLTHNVINNGYLPKDWTLKVLKPWVISEKE